MHMIEDPSKAAEESEVESCDNLPSGRQSGGDCCLDEVSFHDVPTESAVVCPADVGGDAAMPASHLERVCHAAGKLVPHDVASHRHQDLEKELLEFVNLP